MPAAHLPPLLRAQAPAFADRFCALLAHLTTIFARLLYKHPRLGHLTLTLDARLSRLRRRFVRLMTLLAADRLPRPSRTGATRTRTATPSAPRLPTGKAWLLRELAHEGAFIRNQFARMLDEPEMAALIAAAPASANRILDPLRRMLGLPPFEPRQRPRRPQPDPRGVPPPPGPPLALHEIYIWPPHPPPKPPRKPR